MKTIMLALVVGLLLGGAAQRALSLPEENDADDGVIKNTAYMERAKRSVRLELEGSEEIEFRNTRLVRNDEGLVVVCGEAKPGNTQEEKADFIRFVTLGHAESISIEGRTASFSEMWARYCSSSP